MTTVDKISDPTSAATPVSEPLQQPAKRPELRSSSPKTAAELLASEAATARDAAAATFLDLRTRLASVPREWAEQHPWTAVGASLAAGAGFGFLLTRRASHERRPAPTPGVDQASTGDSPTRLATLARLVVGPLFAPLAQAAKLALTQFLVSLATPPPEGDSDRDAEQAVEGRESAFAD